MEGRSAENSMFVLKKTHMKTKTKILRPKKPFKVLKTKETGKNLKGNTSVNKDFFSNNKKLYLTL